MAIEKSRKTPALINEDELVTSDKGKAELLEKTFIAIHSGDHLDDLHREKREPVLREHKNIWEEKENCSSTLDMKFTMKELKTALQGTGNTAPGQDQLCYVMFQQLPEVTFQIILNLFNTIWREGQIPRSWKEAVILPFSKPGKDPENPNNYRPIALMDGENHCK